jgi:Flp pilus assembly protein CpaB
MMEKEKRKNSASKWLLLYFTITLLIGVVIGFALGTFFVTGKTSEPQVIMVTSQPYPTPTPIPYIEVVIAAQVIPCGTEITPNMIGLMPYLADIAPITMYGDIESVIGKYVIVEVPREMLILSGMVVESADDLPANCQSN